MLLCWVPIAESGGPAAAGCERSSPRPPAQVAKEILSAGGLSTPHPFSRQLLPILQKLEFGAGFHVPNDIVPGFGQEKTERREYPPPPII